MKPILFNTEMVRAILDGRLVVLPCKDGKVYTIEEDYFQCDSCEHKAKSYYHQDYKRVMCDNEDAHCPLFVKEHVTEGFEVSFKDGKTVLSAPGEWGYEGLEPFSGRDGKWYLTREEAEAALKGGMAEMAMLYGTMDEIIDLCDDIPAGAEPPEKEA